MRPEREETDRNFRPRVDLVVANYNRAPVFWRGLKSLAGFDAETDRIVFLDASETFFSEKFELEARKEGFGALIGTKNLVIYRRRSWNLVHGAHLDYLDLLSRGELSRPEISFFMQDHYLNKWECVAADTVPEAVVWDLDLVTATIVENRPKQYALFASRNGFRVSALTPKNHRRPDWMDTTVSPEREISFVADGGNLAVDPSILLRYFRANPERLASGVGSYGAAYVWETRFCKILSDSGVVFRDIGLQMEFESVSDLIRQHPSPGKVWKYFWSIPLYFYLHGRDIQKQRLRDVNFSFRELVAELISCVRFPRRTRLEPLSHEMR